MERGLDKAQAKVFIKDCDRACFVFREAISECRILKTHTKARPQISKHIHWDLMNCACAILAALLVFL